MTRSSPLTSLYNMMKYTNAVLWWRYLSVPDVVVTVGRFYGYGAALEAGDASKFWNRLNPLVLQLRRRRPAAAGRSEAFSKFWFIYKRSFINKPLGAFHQSDTLKLIWIWETEGRGAEGCAGERKQLESDPDSSTESETSRQRGLQRERDEE